ncbi:MAG: hypothetical protein JWO84_131 [Parcubacteria group bacterium]|nr:hypothetical protein [Parcubacteria group bacterium]
MSAASHKRPFSPMAFAFYVVIAVVGLSIYLFVSHATHMMDARAYLPLNNRDQVAVSQASATVVQTPPDPRSSCPALHDGESWTCEYGKAGTRPIAISGVTRGNEVTQSADIDSANEEAYYTSADGTEHRWKGTDEDKNASKTHWRYVCLIEACKTTYSAP